jgi:hypothetical protein
MGKMGILNGSDGFLLWRFKHHPTLVVVAGSSRRLKIPKMTIFMGQIEINHLSFMEFSWIFSQNTRGFWQKIPIAPSTRK